MDSNAVVSALALLTGIGLLIAGAWSALQTRAFLRRSVRATGTVVELISVRELGRYRVQRGARGTSIEPHRSYRPVVRFTGPDSREYEVTGTVFASPAPFQPGEPAPVRYDPSDPSDARIDRPLYLWFGPAMLVGFGFFAIAMGLLGIALR